MTRSTELACKHCHSDFPELEPKTYEVTFQCAPFNDCHATHRESWPVVGQTCSGEEVVLVAGGEHTVKNALTHLNSTTVGGVLLFLAKYPSKEG